jgi:hypothetical protein
MPTGVRSVRPGDGRKMVPPKCVRLLLALSLLAGCVTLDDQGRRVERGERAMEMPIVIASPEQRVGEIEWISGRGDFVVVLLDGPFALEETFLLVRNREMEIVAVLLSDERPRGRATGARVVEGRPLVGKEVVLPGPEWTQYLFRRYQPR